MKRLSPVILYLFPFFVAFIYIPGELYSPNVVGWRWSEYLLTYTAGMGLVTAVAVFTLLWLGSKIFGFSWRRASYWLFILGLYIVFADAISPLQLGLLDGTVSVSPQPIFHTLVEIILLGTVLSLGYLFRAEKYARGCLLVAALGILFILGNFAYALGQSPAAAGSRTAESNSSDSRADKPNVYHIVLDEMQTDYFLAALEDPTVRSCFRGFSLFRNNVANYSYTSASLLSYLTGTIFTGGSYREWMSRNPDNLFHLASRAGYDICIYGTPKLTLIGPPGARYVSQDTLLKDYSGLRYPLLTEFIRLWLARLMPNFATNRALDWGARLGKGLSELIEPSKGGYIPKTIKEGSEPFSGMLMFKDALQTEADRSAKSSYLYLHPLLPHCPYVLDEECNYSRISGETAPLYLRQVRCTVSLLVDFLSELRRLGRLNESIVVVHSDHGSGWAGFLAGSKSGVVYSSLEGPPKEKSYDKNIHYWSKHHLEARSMALLMIKPPFAEGEFKVLDAATQLADVCPTILEYADLGVPEGDIEGRSLVKCLAGSGGGYLENRGRYFHYFPATGMKDSYYRFQISINDLHRPQFDVGKEVPVRSK